MKVFLADHKPLFFGHVLYSQVLNVLEVINFHPLNSSKVCSLFLCMLPPFELNLSMQIFNSLCHVAKHEKLH